MVKKEKRSGVHGVQGSFVSWLWNGYPALVALSVWRSSDIRGALTLTAGLGVYGSGVPLTCIAHQLSQLTGRLRVRAFLENELSTGEA
jgi:hypothetical protein